MSKFANLKVTFLTRSKRNIKSKKELLYARITVNKKRLEISMGKEITIGIFNPKLQICDKNNKESRQVNNYLEIIKNEFYQIRKDLIIENEDISVEIVRARYDGKALPGKKKIPTLIELYKEHNLRFKSLIGTKDHSRSTYTRHVTSLNHVIEFIQSRYNIDDISLKKINNRFLMDYEVYLKTEKGCNHNSTMKYIKNLGKVIRIAISDDLLSVNPFNKFKLTYEKVDRIYLTVEEIHKIINKEIQDERMDRIRDLFLFCIYTGLAFVDLKNLKMSNIEIDHNGVHWIKNKRVKTNTSFMIPLMEIPKQIISKYKGHKLRKQNDLVIPGLSNQKYNAYLKELASICGISKNLTSHVARHTFATTVTLSRGVGIEVISKMLGHTSIKTTQLYATVQQDAILKGMEKLI